MKNIYIILPPALPFPPSKGGAVETLLQIFVSENEKEKKYHLTIFSVEDEKARELSKLYSYADVVYIAYQESKPKAKIDKCLKENLHININALNSYTVNILKKIKEMGRPDLCIVEGGNYRDYQIISRYIGLKKTAIHIHAVSTPKVNANKIYGSFIFVSECAKRYWCKSIPCNGFVLKNVVDEDVFCGNHDVQGIADKRKQLGIGPDDFLVMYCGRLIEEKGVIELVKAISKVKNPQVKLLVVGSSKFAGAEVTEYQRQLFEIAGNNVIFAGFINNQELPLYYLLSDVIATPSICNEAAPLVNIEAMLSGRALITTSQGGIPEYVNPEGAVVIDYDGNKEHLVGMLASAIENLAENPQPVQMMGESNREYSMRFSKKNYFKDYASIIDSISS